MRDEDIGLWDSLNDLRLALVQLERLQDENARLRKALEEYADKDHWTPVDPADKAAGAGLFLGKGWNGWELAAKALNPEKEAR